MTTGATTTAAMAELRMTAERARRRSAVPIPASAPALALASPGSRVTQIQP